MMKERFGWADFYKEVSSGLLSPEEADEKAKAARDARAAELKAQGIKAQKSQRHERDERGGWDGSKLISRYAPAFWLSYDEEPSRPATSSDMPVAGLWVGDDEVLISEGEVTESADGSLSIQFLGELIFSERRNK